ncbi:MAG: phosphoenolpyruvate--protein phosphotransferase [Desulfobacteraceae bacterium]|jgi:phosphotransferase system enzyme I (PtsI)
MRKGAATKINKLEGIAVSPGIIVGKARLVDRSRVKILYQYLIGDKQVSQEVERFKEALNATKQQIIALKNGMPDQLKQHAFILDTQLMIMDDGMLSKSTVDTITKEKMNAEWALKKSMQKIRQLFQQIDDGYIRERINDVEYVAERVLRNLAGKEQERLSEITDRVIIVAHDLSPADTSEMNIGKVMGFITDVGGPTSHTAIMAQALEIPAVVGLESITQRVQDGVLLVVDGNSGEVIIDPDDEVIISYQEKQLELERYRSSIDRISHLPAETVDGHRIAVHANLELLEEVVSARDHGAEGIGLYRTEFLYLRSKGVPSEKELYEDYKELAEIVAPAPVNIRTLDIGGDKFSSDLNLTREMNPALGLRAIRFCLREPKIFKSQLRAVLRASAYGQVRLLLPMISGLQEILDTKRILKDVKKELNKKKIKYARNIKVGIMIEIPSAVTMADALAKHVDFFSIGTNDLIQYALAIDRINEHVAYMYQPFHPAILKMIQHVVMAAKNAGIKVALCGEMAGDPLCVFILVGLGLDELSMNAQSIPMIKKIIRSISMKEAQADLEHIMQLETAKEVRKFIVKKMKPLISELDEKGYYIKVS